MLKINKDIQIGDTGRTLEMLGETVAETLPVGTIAPYGGAVNQVPQNWLPCDGREVSRLEYAKLFSIIGTRFGVGDGSTTFELPDLQGRVPVGQDTNDAAFDVLGETGGEKTHTLTVDEIPSHTHAGWGATQAKNTGSQYRYQYNEQGYYAADNTDKAAGGGQAHNNLQPYQVTLYIIKAFDQQLGNLRSESLPVGSEIDFDGTASEIPEGWEAVGRKTNPYFIKKQDPALISWTVVNEWSCIPYQSDVDSYGDFSSWSFPTSGSSINRFIVGNNASKIKVSAEVAVRGNGISGWFMLGVYKGTNSNNETQLKKVINTFSNGGWVTGHIEHILDVSAGDWVSVKVMKDTNGTLDLNSLSTSFGNAPCSTITIEILED